MPDCSVPIYIPRMSLHDGPDEHRSALRGESPAQRTMDALRRIVRTLGTSARSAPGARGISGAQLFLLRAIEFSPGMSLSELATRAMARQSTISEVVARLVERRLVVRAKADDDARRVALSLTPRGRAIVERAPQTAQERLVAGLEALTASEQRRLADSLELWLDRAGFTDVEPSMFFEGTHAGRGTAAAPAPTSADDSRTNASGTYASRTSASRTHAS